MDNIFIGKDINNKVYLCGEIISDFEQDELKKSFSRVYVRIIRLSGSEDILPIIIRSRCVTSDMVRGSIICCWGQLINNDYTVDGVKHRNYSILVKRVLDSTKNYNTCQILLCGYICKAPKYHTTPLGKRITDLCIAVNCRNYQYYLPAIAWGKVAVFSRNLQVKNRIVVFGFIQSRKCEKILQDKRRETYTLIDISIAQMGVVDKSDKFTTILYQKLNMGFPRL